MRFVVSSSQGNDIYMAQLNLVIINILVKVISVASDIKPDLCKKGTLLTHITERPKVDAGFRISGDRIGVSPHLLLALLCASIIVRLAFSFHFPSIPKDVHKAT